MTLQQLHYFLAAIEHGTLSKAAELLNVAQPTLSDQIIRLEESMGTTLFIRTNRKLMLTEAGRRLQPFPRRPSLHRDRAMRRSSRFGN